MPSLANTNRDPGKYRLETTDPGTRQPSLRHATLGSIKTNLVGITAALAVLITPAAFGAAAPSAPITLMIAVDRSGSVQRAGTGPLLRKALAGLIESTRFGKTVFTETRDVIGLGSFGASWKLDFAPAATFRSGSRTLAQAIESIPFETGATNTAEALFQAYQEIRRLNRADSTNVILLVTDGRPNAFTASFDGPSECQLAPPKTGVLVATVGRSWPPLPPTVSGGDDNMYTFGLFKPAWAGFDLTFVDHVNCRFSNGVGQPIRGSTFHLDFPDLPEVDAHGNSLFGPICGLEDRSTASPRSVRFAAINAADNMATTIRTDRSLRPILLVVGFDQTMAGEESIDPAWLARVANDIFYQDFNKRFILQADQTPGEYFASQPVTLQNALIKVASYISLVAEFRGNRSNKTPPKPAR